MMMVTYHIPVRPYGPIDALNRRAAAVGSPRYAEQTGHADYNGHRVTVSWNEYRGYYVTEYFWAGRVVLARGTFANCLRAALDEQARGALGSSTYVRLREGDAEAEALCNATPELVPGSAPETLSWWTWRHDVAVQSARDYAIPDKFTLIFDWPMLQAAATREEYDAAVKAKYGRVWN